MPFKAPSVPVLRRPMPASPERKLLKGKSSHLPVKGLNLFSKSNCCFPMVPRSTLRSGQIAYSSIFLLIWKILSVIPSGAGPTRYNGRGEEVKETEREERAKQR